MDLGVFYQIVVPLLEMRQAVLIMISTPTGTWRKYIKIHLIEVHLTTTIVQVFITHSLIW